MAKALQAWGRSTKQYLSPSEVLKLHKRHGVRCRSGVPCIPPLNDDQKKLFELAISTLGPSTRNHCSWVIDAIDEAAQGYISHAAKEISAPRNADLNIELTHHLNQLTALRKSFEDLSIISLGTLQICGAFEFQESSHASNRQRSRRSPPPRRLCLPGGGVSGVAT